MHGVYVCVRGEGGSNPIENPNSYMGGGGSQSQLLMGSPNLILSQKSSINFKLPIKQHEYFFI